MGIDTPVPENLSRYLSSGPGQHRRWAFENVPLHMEIKMPVAQWRTNLANWEIASSVRGGVEAGLEAAQERGEVVTRSDLMALSAALVGDSDLVAAHRTAHLPGGAESYFTKWLWACGLPRSPPAGRRRSRPPHRGGPPAPGRSRPADADRREHGRFVTGCSTPGPPRPGGSC